MLLHLLHDDKVCNRTIANFEEALPNKNIYICIADRRNLQYISADAKVVFINNPSSFSNVSLLDNVKCVLIHYLDRQKIEFVNKYISDPNIKIIWSLWGGDIYNDILISYGYNPYYERSFVQRFSFKIKVVSILIRMLGGRTYLSKVKETTTFIEKRVDVLLSSEAEFELIKSYLKNTLNCHNASLTLYYPIEDTLGGLFKRRITGNNIVIGNSASFTNNHLYAFDFLGKLNTRGRDKIVPLSYGGSPEYINHVEKCGDLKWGYEFRSVRNFMPLEEYNRMMLSASVFIYGNWRQEAIGNIVIALYLGAKVFISEKSPLLRHFSSKGIKVYVTERMTQDDIDSPISNADFECNREAIMRLYSREVIISHIRSFFSAYIVLPCK